MPIMIKTFTLGPLQNNCYLIFDDHSKSAALIDPPYGVEVISQYLNTQKLDLQMILITHAHFDHIGGLNMLVQSVSKPIDIYLHPDDQRLWDAGGGAKEFGFYLELPVLSPKPVLDQSIISLGENLVHVLHTPGHSPGHVVYYVPGEKSIFCGDLIFYHGVGRTDLPGGSARTLIHSIEKYILSFPDDVRLYPGHGASTTVGEERVHNPFLI
jgi:glyoxylase-like metal-dependent hydrolase (beta-lactamase superfamily II)